MAMDKSEIAKIVHYHRKRGNLSRLELAELAEVGKTVIYDIEKARKDYRIDTLLKVLRVLNIDLRLESPLMEEYEASSHKEK
jgi:HTH-type transcriptional regulator/antitoxin HipB